MGAKEWLVNYDVTRGERCDPRIHQDHPQLETQLIFANYLNMNILFQKRTLIFKVIKNNNWDGWHPPL